MGLKIILVHTVSVSRRHDCDSMGILFYNISLLTCAQSNLAVRKSFKYFTLLHRFGNRGQKRSREEDDNVDLMNQELPSKRMDRRDYTERSGRPQRKKMPGNL